MNEFVSKWIESGTCLLWSFVLGFPVSPFPTRREMSLCGGEGMDSLFRPFCVALIGCVRFEVSTLKANIIYEQTSGCLVCCWNSLVLTTSHLVGSTVYNQTSISLFINHILHKKHNYNLTCIDNQAKHPYSIHPLRQVGQFRCLDSCNHCPMHSAW